MVHTMKFVLSLSMGAVLTSCTLVSIRGQSIESVFARVQNAVVTIHTGEMRMEPTSGGMARPATVEGIGSGVLVSATGRILTAAHVVQTAERIRVMFPSGEIIPAKVVASEPLADVAMIQLQSPPPSKAPIASLADSDKARIGQRVFVVGAPRGMTHTLTVGHLSARRIRSGLVRGMIVPEFFQTDAAINKGNSGGPMFDMNGEVLGIVSYIISESGGSEGLGFAVTSNLTRQLLIDSPAFWTGLEAIQLIPELAGLFNVPEGQTGLLVQRVATGSPAHAMGIRGGRYAATIEGEELLLGGDIILEVEGIPVVDRARVYESLRRKEGGEEIRVRVLRAGRFIELKGSIPRD